MANNLEFGSNGTLIATAQGTVVDTFVAIYCIADGNVTVDVNWENATVDYVVPMVAGQTIYGVFTKIATDGTVVAYK